MIYGITLITLSLVAIPSLLLCKKSNARELLKEIEPYQSWIGFIFCLMAIWNMIQTVLNTDLLKLNIIWWYTLLISCSIQFVLGFMLSFGYVNRIISYTIGKEKEAQIRERIAPKQGKLGLIGLLVGVWVIMADFIYL